VSIAIVPVWLFRERRYARDAGALESPASYRAIAALLRDWMRKKETRWLVAFVATYKVGEVMADQMFKPFLVDAGFSNEQLGLWVGTWGMVFSIAGSFLGGVLASRVGIAHAVALTAIFRVIPVA